MLLSSTLVLVSENSPAHPHLDVGVALGVLTQLHQSRMQQLLAPHGLTTTQLGVLTHLVRHDDSQSISDLAHAVEINQPGVTKVCRRLAELGTVTITADPGDKRVRRVAITEAGRQLLQRTNETLGQDFADWLGDWDKADLATLTTQIWRLASWLDDNRLG